MFPPWIKFYSTRDTLQWFYTADVERVVVSSLLKDNHPLGGDIYRQHHENKRVQYTSSIHSTHYGLFAQVTKVCQWYSFCDANQSCRLRKVLHSSKPRLAVSTYCGLLGVSLLTRTHLAQVQKNTFCGANWSCRLRKCLCRYKEDAHTVACWVSPTDQYTSCITLCSTNWSCRLRNVLYTVTSLGQIQSSHALLFYGITLERSVAFRN